MTFNRKPSQQALLPEPDKPGSAIATRTSEEFKAVCARGRAGEFRILSISRGRDNSEWVFSVDSVKNSC